MQMMDNYSENNSAVVSGIVNEDCVFSHEVYGEGFYTFTIKAKRLSGSYDMIPVLISERIISPSSLTKGLGVKIDGQFRSYNNPSNTVHKLVLTVFARDIHLIDGDTDEDYPNSIELNGYICKKPIFRKTPSGREIADVLLAVNRSYNKSDYIPCISWGRNARYCEQLNVGDNLKIWGRIQSRDYQKKREDGSAVTRTAYEVSVSKLIIAPKSDTDSVTETDKAPVTGHAVSDV